MKRARARWLVLLSLVPCVLVACSRHESESSGDSQGAEESAATDSVVTLDAEAVSRAGIEVEPAGPASIDVTIELPGEVRLDPRKVLDVRPRFPGVVRQIQKDLGQAVRRGEVLALVESNESLTNYEVVSSIAGQVVARTAAPGQTVTPETVLFTVADLSNVWIEFGVYPNQLGCIRRGQPARVVSQSGGGSDPATISYMGPTVDPETRVAVGRIVLPNKGNRWEPGMFVVVTVTVDHVTAPVAVRNDAIVRTAEGPAVFVAEGTRFHERHVQPGLSDSVHTEIVTGLTAGTPVASRNAFTLKSELEKAVYAE